MEATDEIRIEPFGVHIWNDDRAATVFIDTEVKNYGERTETVELVSKLSNDDGRQVFRLVEEVTLAPGETKTVRQSSSVENPVLWSTENPYLYKLASMIKREVKAADEVKAVAKIKTTDGR